MFWRVVIDRYVRNCLFTDLERAVCLHGVVVC